MSRQHAKCTSFMHDKRLLKHNFKMYFKEKKRLMALLQSAF